MVGLIFLLSPDLNVVPGYQLPGAGQKIKITRLYAEGS